MIWFTSDLHFGHRAAITMNNRPFSNVEEMNEELIRRFNEVVGEEDTVYILGDICYRIPVEEANALIARLHGRKILCKGNHDKEYDANLFDGIYDYLRIHEEGLVIALMHYPMMEWLLSYHGAIHLHGHMHNTAEYNLRQQAQGIRRYDVGVDANNYAPVSLQMIMEFFGIENGRE